MTFRLGVLCGLLAVLFSPVSAGAADILNINPENADFYAFRGFSSHKMDSGYNVAPMSCYRLEKAGLDSASSGCPAEEAEKWNFKPLFSVTAKFLVGNEKQNIIPGSSGLVYYKGGNLFLFEDGYATYGDSFALYYQLKQIETEQLNQGQIFRAYAKYRLGKWSIEAGKDNVALGPGEYGGLLLSTHAEPYPLIKLATEEPLNFLGKWDVTLMNGWLLGSIKQDPADSKLLAMRVTYSPADWLELGGTKITHYGGAGRPTYQPGDYPTLLTGGSEHATGGKFDNDGILSFDATLRLPLDRIFPSVKSFTIYDEEAAGDPSFWFMSTPPNSPRPGFVDWNQPSNLWGMTLAFEDDFFRLEYQKVCLTTYLHHHYPYDGYTYNGISLGAITGTNSRSMVFSHMHRFSEQSRLRYQIGRYEDPKYTEPLNGVPQLQMIRDFIVVEPQRSFGSSNVSLYLRYDHTTNYDTNFLPNQYNIVPEDQNFYTVGISVTMAL